MTIGENGETVHLVHGFAENTLRTYPVLASSASSIWCSR